MHEIVDVLVVGAGLTGCIATKRCLATGLSALCVDQNPKPTDIEDTRAVVLTEHTLLACERQNILLPTCHDIERLTLKKDHQPLVTLEAKAIHQKRLGAILNIKAILSDALATTRFEAQVMALAHTDPGWRVTLTTPEGIKRIQCSYLLAADGANSIIRTLAGIQATRHPMPYVATICPVTLDSDQEAWLSLGNEGTDAFLPKGPREGVMVWTRKSPIPSVEGLLPSNLLATGALKHFPLQSMQALQSCRPGLFLLGQAKLVVPPVAAQGLNIGIRDALLSVDLIQQHLNHQDQVRAYEKQHTAVAKYLSHAPLYRWPAFVFSMPWAWGLKQCYQYL
jgi:2-octaprenyl-6-methoxyphenol hydroxylase